jgi:hypothetical protein
MIEFSFVIPDAKRRKNNKEEPSGQVRKPNGSSQDETGDVRMFIQGGSV